jgi:RNA-directed DNA polymerase
LVNTDELEDTAYVAERRVLKIQAKLHRWAAEDASRCFDDLYNLVCDPAFLLTGWMRVRSNKGARTAGVDGETAHYIEDVRGLDGFLAELRSDLKARSFRPLPVRQRGIPKAGGKVRYLGINTIRDRVVQASLKLVLEPIYEADFLPCSYGFRPKRRAHDAIAESRHLASHSYEWIVEGDIEGCFDNIGHTAVLERMRARVGDKRVLALVKAFLKAGILTEEAGLKESRAGAPQGGILSPLIANIALSVLDEAIAAGPGGPNTTPGRRAHRRIMGRPNYRICRYADDCAPRTQREVSM